MRMKDHRIYVDKKRIEKRKIYYSLKRIFDILLSAVGLIISSVIFLLVTIAIKREDNGPVIYKQRRVGKNGKEFDMYKFRSMCVDADEKLAALKEQNEVEGAMFKIKDDPRITKVGKFIRKTSIDELPQLYNVLRGDMSIVGPRPPLPSEVAEYTEYDMQRLWVIPGCTGLWQATVRNTVGFDEMVQLDLEYIQKSSLWYDFYIILLTVKMLISPKGAY
jgi:lipopolysaccharide/colanic/teichoic acid biosynthesis glycosyltransferase